MVRKEYEIDNLHCADCSLKIEDQISKLPEVSLANLDFVNKKLVVHFNSPVENALERLNLVASGIEPGVYIFDINHSPVLPAKSFYPWFAGFGLLLLMIALTASVSPKVSFGLGLAAYLLVAHRVLWSALRKLKTLRVFDEHLLMTLATLGALYLGEYPEAIAVMLLYEIGQYLEARAVNQSRALIKRILTLRPEKARLLSANGLNEVPLKEVAIGDIIQVFPGERIPLDGTVIKGQSSVDTSSLTGEAMPVPVEKGSSVFGGFINTGGLLDIEVTHSEAQSTVSRILGLIESASARKSSTEKFITRFARWYTPLVVVSALLLLIIPLLFGGAFDTWLPRALIFLIVSCPCAFVIAIPLTYYIGIGAAARKGIIFKGSAFMDSLRNASTMVFDKTGTLTTGNLRVAEVIPEEGVSPAELREAVFRCEYSSNHPLAKAIKQAADYQYDSAQVRSFTEYPGKGIRMNYAGDDLIVGSAKLLAELGFQFEVKDTELTSICAVKNNRLLGLISFSDEIKSTMADSLTELRKLGFKHFSMLSGDKKVSAALTAKSLHLDSFHAGLLPEEKVSQLEAIMQSRSGKTVYVGDGLNDAPVLARADIGIAMGEIGNAASIESADIVLLNDRPEQLVRAVRISQLTYKTVVQNVVLALGIKIIVMIAGALGLGNLWEAVIADVGVTLLAVFNAMRLASKSA